ncbi:MAG: DUF3795 domain-containing protein, partial [Bacteroidales bacterium]|nr:DUF3795 domain-containing protein [Bacteroidales bacterium]
MKQVIPNSELIAKCGLYCGACKRYLNDNCPGCADNSKASWCKIRSCCMDKEIASCADCDDYTNVAECKLRSGFMTNIFSFIFNSDRNACI